jgi:hypothetical protein
MRETKSYEFECWKIKDDNKRIKKAIPSKIEEAFLRRCQQMFGESEEAVKKFYGANLSIYRGEGG